MKALSLLFSFAVLGIVSAGLWLSSAPDATEIAPPTLTYVTGGLEAESTWAAGLLETVRQADPQAGGANARAALLDALDQAEQRSAVYVSIAELDGGAWETFPSLNLLRRELERRAGNLGPRLSQVAAQSAPQDRLTLHLLESLRAPLEEYRKSTDPEAPGLRLAELFTQGANCTIVCLEAAVAEDPSSAIAWSGLALRADPTRRAEAVVAWQQLEPDNAAAWYVEALVRQANGDTAAATAAIIAGNHRPRCRFPTLEPPTRFQLSYPQDAALEGASGRPVTAVALSNLVYLQVQGSNAPNPSADLHRLALTLSETASTGRNGTEAKQLAQALQRLGSQLLTAEQATATLVRHGTAILQIGAGIESSIDTQAALSGYDFHLQRSTRELSAGLGRWNERARQLLEDRESILRGQVDLRGEELTAMQKLVTEPRLQPVLAAKPDSPR